MSTSHPDFPYSISRFLEGEGDQEIELAIQVRDYEPPDKRHYYGCEYFPGSVEFGDAVVVATGNTIELTELEWEAVEAAFWG